MRYYFQLQLKRARRIISAQGIPPAIGLIGGITLFALGSVYLFWKTSFAASIYVLFYAVLISIMRSSEADRLLDSLFSRKQSLKIRLLENSLTGLPFIAFLLYKGQTLFAAGIFLFAAMLAFVSIKRPLGRTIPTPFRKMPFEFIIGFRKMFWLLAILLFVLAKALQVSNFNLGLFTLGAVFLIGMNFYTQPEPLHFVWSYTHCANKFLRLKLQVAAVCTTLLAATFILALLVFFPQQYLFVLGITSLGYTLLFMMIFAKYSAYPKSINVPQSILFGLSIIAPPILPLISWLFYAKAKKQLQTLLEC